MKLVLVVISIVFSSLPTFATELEKQCLREAKTAAQTEANNSFPDKAHYGFDYFDHRYLDTVPPGIISYEIIYRANTASSEVLFVSVVVSLNIDNNCEKTFIDSETDSKAEMQD